MEKSVVEYLLKSAEKYPDKVAFKDKDKEVTFSQLDRTARIIAKNIRERIGDCRNEPIAVYMEKGVDCITAFMGILYSGNFYSPIDIHSPTDRINIVLEVLKPILIISNEAGRKSAEYDQLKVDAGKIIYLEQMDQTDTEYYVKDLLQNMLDVDPLYVLFTSGSTGIPKGVVISHRSMLDYAEWLTETFHFNENTIFGNQAPLYFDNSTLDIYQTLKNGATMVIIPEKLFMFHGQLIKFMNENQINTIFWVPSALISVANSGILEKERLLSLENVLFCGEVMPVKPFNVWKHHYPDLLYANLYGPTEITDVCTYYVVDREFKETESLPIGRACRNTEILVLNEKNQLVGADEAGELCVRGISLSLGYYERNDKTEEAFVQNPLHNRYRDIIYRTGDIVKYNEFGEIMYLCRKDSQIKYQGHRIELGEIDSAGYSIDGVRQACTLFDGNRIIFVCSLTKKVAEKDIYAELKQKVPKYMLPKLIIILEDLPLNANGKIDRPKLKLKIQCRND